MIFREMPRAFCSIPHASRRARGGRGRLEFEVLEDRTLLASNPIVAENLLPGNPASEWDVSGAGDPTLQGFATDISVDHGQTVTFKIDDTTGASYHIDVYRMGYYGGLGARKVATISASATLHQVQPAGLSDPTTGLLDCGNWAVSASWAVPASATSGVYFARLVRDDTGGASQIPFIVRDDEGHSDLLYQTSDATWEAYNNYGGNSLYEGSSSFGTRAVKVSYNRPWNTRATTGGLGETNWFFWAEYPMVRWMEENGYDVSYFTDVDSDRLGSEILQHKVFLSVGHDEYWSGAQRTNVEVARDAGVDLAFFSGNEVFWKTRWETSIDGSGTPYRTLVCYKETHADAKIDPLTNVWTGSWRDPRFSPPADGGRPENNLTGTIFTVNQGAGGDFGTAIQVPAADALLRFWRNTSIATLQPGQTATLANGTLGYEWDEDLDNGARPAGLIQLSSTTENVPQRIQDYGNDFGPATATHSLTLYRADSGALVFAAGTVQWSFGLDGTHDGQATVPDPRMQQATVNLFADMGVQPGTLQPGLVPATASTDTARPTSIITSLAAGTLLQSGVPITISGTATDTGGGIVAAVEISTDGGLTWHRATGRTSWSYSWIPTAGGATHIRTRAVDDSANQEIPTAGVPVTVSAPSSLWNASVTPTDLYENDTHAAELGLKFTSDVAGSINGVRFYKGPSNTGTHVAHLWTSTGTLLASATFTNESASGWQQVSFSTPVTIAANTTYIVSYFAPVGQYAASSNYFSNSGFDSAPLHTPSSAAGGGNGVYLYGSSGGFPTSTYNGTNYWVDPLFTASGTNTTPPTVTSSSPAANATGVSTATAITATFSEPVQAGSVVMTLTGPGGAVSGSLAYNNATNTATFTPAAALAVQTTYVVNVSGAKDQANNVMTSVSWSFTTAATAGSPSSLWNAAVTPAIGSVNDTHAVELGLKFTSDVAGTINGVRFYKGPSNTGTHVAHLWTSTGTLLASATFTNESASGWQQVSFSTPVSIAANTTYIVSYFAPVGEYAANSNYFSSSGFDNAPLHAPSNAAGGGNGVYLYGSSGGFPTSTYNGTNYWVDPLFTASGTNTTPPTVTSSSPAANATGVSTATAITATFSEPVQAGSVVMTLTGPGGAVSGSLAYNNATNTATFTPAAALAVQTTYVVNVSGAKDQANNVMTSVSWSFTTAATGTTSGLVAAYGFNEGTGTTVTDVSGHGLNGVIVNATWTTAGRFGDALSFNGTNAMVTVNENSLLDLTNGMTLEAWVKPVALNGWTTTILKERPGGLAYSLYASDNVGRPPAGYINVSGTDSSVVGASALALNTWTYMTATYDGAAMRLYINGTLVQTRSLAGTIITSNNALRIGGNTIWGEYFNGLIDEVRVYNRALAPSEIQVDMNTPIGGGSGALMATAAPAVSSASAPLTPAAMAPLVTEAVARWQDALPAGTDLSVLAHTPIRIADLPGTQLGWTGDGAIWINQNAAGYGWFVDPTPQNDSEFTQPGDQGEQGRIDLLTVLAHEMGHVLGFGHEAEGVMAEALGPGVRRLPGSPLSHDEALASLAQTDHGDDDLRIPMDDPTLTQLASELIQARANRSRLVVNQTASFLDPKLLSTVVSSKRQPPQSSVLDPFQAGIRGFRTDVS
ncbi:DUF4082 domain-containing protein [Singulisphaera acidiphila]|uniref:Mo-co oxidoreductase dimerization domain protein n=3 Tax=Singulisphaera acidiphila TaxID=466153 RepID=L0DQN9_SINAD|nr:DUF4082 domain-containing protein [Singulisphaera acidiphila]AGA31260.1 Mo-co oxidoreductase dimerization domain protein [Singulisphaera acidiphila DSM 18658]